MREFNNGNIQSNKGVYLLTKYSSLLIGVAFLIENYFFTSFHSENGPQLLFGLFIISFGLLMFYFVRFAKVNINQIQHGVNKNVKWSDVRYIERIGFLFLVITKRPQGLILFPIDKLGSLLWYYSDSTMVQFISKAKEKYGL
jgi:hypothetical protein